MSKVIHSLADVNAVFSLEAAAAAGYWAHLEGDGNATVRNGDGRTYHIRAWCCDCPDSVIRGGSYRLADGRDVCKHVLLLLQVRPCPCGHPMVWTGGAYFYCYHCGRAFDVRLVREERRSIPEPSPEPVPFRWDAETADLAAQDTAESASLLSYAV